MPSRSSSIESKPELGNVQSIVFGLRKSLSHMVHVPDVEEGSGVSLRIGLTDVTGIREGHSGVCRSSEAFVSRLE